MAFVPFPANAKRGKAHRSPDPQIDLRFLFHAHENLHLPLVPSSPFVFAGSGVKRSALISYNLANTQQLRPTRLISSSNSVTNLHDVHHHHHHPSPPAPATVLMPQTTSVDTILGTLTDPDPSDVLSAPATSNRQILPHRTMGIRPLQPSTV